MFAVNSEILHTGQDYLVFAGLTVGVFGLLEFSLRRFWRGAHLPWPAWGVLLAVVGGGWWAAQNACEDAKDDMGRLVSALAPTYAAEMAQMDHHKITLETKPDDPLYLKMIEAEKRWQALNPYAHDIYTIRQTPDGKKRLIVDSETDYDHNGDFLGATEGRTPIGKEYQEADPGLDFALSGHANFDQEIVKDDWGIWVSAWAPIMIDGKVDAVLGVDFDAHRYAAVISEANGHIIERLALLALAVGIGGAAFAIQRADLRRRVEIEARSRKSEERMLLTVRKLPLGFIEWNDRAEVVAWNPSAERIFGFKAEEVFGKEAFRIIVAPGSREHVDKIWASLIRQTGGTHSINDNLTKDGRTIVVEWFNTPLLTSQGKVTGVFSLMQDITERVNLEKHVQQAQRLNAVGQLAAGIAHDFNNILTIITGHAGLLLGLPGLPREAHPELERIEEAALRAARLTRQLLAFSRQQAMFPRALHLNEVVTSSATMLARVVGADVSLNVQFAEDAPPIEADPAMLDQMITNLVLNARDAMPNGGAIRIAVDRVDISEETADLNSDARSGPAVRLSVSDTGLGIPPEHLPRIFEPFYTTKKTGQGTGLGLSVVHGIMKQHHGWIKVESTVGHGTTFHLHFPPTPKTPETEEPMGAYCHVPTSRTNRQTVLVVEDEAIVRELARMILEREGYRVLEAEDGPSALRVWAEQGPAVDLLLTDMVMPNGITGRELSLRLLAERPSLPIIYASGYSIELTAPDFQPNERQIFLQKPYLTDQLVTTVRRCLQAAQMETRPS